MTPSNYRLIAFLVLAGGLSVPAMGRKVVLRQQAIPAAGSVPLPYVIRDNFGVTWDIQHDGTIGDGGNDLYDGAAHLAVNDTGFNGQQSAAYDPATNELSFNPQQIGEVRVSRRVAVSVAGGWCRWTEILENPTAVAVRVTLRLNFDMGGGVQATTPVNDPKKNTPIGMSVFDGRRAVAMLGGAAGDKVICRYNALPQTDQCNLAYEVEIPPKQTAAVVHFQAMRASNDQAVEFLRTAKEKDLFAGMPKEVRRLVVNFRKSDAVLADIELPRVELQDIIELRTGDQYRGALADAVFKLDCSYGKVELPADRVIGMINAGSYQPTQLFVAVSGEIIGGRLSSESLQMRLSSGQTIAVPLSQIAKVGCRKRPGETDEFKFDKPMLFLRDGQRLIIDAPADSISVATLFGNLKLRAESVATLAFTGEDQPLHRVTLRDGSKFAALISGETVGVHFRGAAGTKASPEPTAISVASIDRIQLLPGEIEPPDEHPLLTLANGDMLAAGATGVIEVQTGFDVLRINGNEIRSIRPVEPPDGARPLPGEMTVGLWGGATVSGRARQDSIGFAVAGSTVNIPVAAISLYEHPRPSAPASMVEQIRLIVAQLSDPDWKKRERAAEQLRSIGPSAVVVLREMRQGQPPEAQTQIDTILKGIESDKPKAKAGPIAPDLNKDAEFNKDDLIIKG